MTTSAQAIPTKKGTPSRAVPTYRGLEALEARIAPAVLVAGGNLLGGTGNPATGDYSIGENTFTAVKVLAGQAVVWFDGFNVTGISVGPNAQLDILGDVFGDIVANLDSTGRITDSDNNPANGRDGGVLLASPIKGIKIRPLAGEAGSVGNIVTGGSIAGLDISGSVKGIYAGDGAFHADSEIGDTGTYTFNIGTGIDSNPIQAGVDNTISLTRAAAKMTPGAGINGAIIGTADEMQMFSGSGNPGNAVLTGVGPAGGNISGVKILAAKTTGSVPSYAIHAGDGATGKIGGAGGTISNLIEKTSSGNATVQAGNGGDGNGGAGGAGGSIKNSEFGSLSAAFNIVAGNGGAGAPGGAGGSVVGANFSSLALSSALLGTGDFDDDGTDEIVVADASSGKFIVAKSADNGRSYSIVTQYIDPLTSAPVQIVTGSGFATDLDILDYDGDDDPDVLITYGSSGTIIANLHQSGGRFYNSVDENYVTETFSYTDKDNFKATLIEKVGAGFIIAAATSTKTRIVDMPDPDNLTTTNISGTFPGIPTDMDSWSASGMNIAYIGLNNGTLLGITPGATSLGTSLNVGGTVQSLTLGDDGETLAVLTKSKKILAYTTTAGAGATLLGETLLATTITGAVEQIQFLPDGDADTNDQLLLGSSAATAQFDILERPDTGTTYTSVRTVPSENAFKRFAVAFNNDDTSNLIAVTGAVNLVGFAPSFGTFETEPLPFNGKQLQMSGGNGGNGLNLANLIGKGGAGGGVSGISVEAVDIAIQTGRGGDSQGGAAGAGGSIANAPTLTTVDGTVISPILRGTSSLSLVTSDGGNGLTGTKAAGGAGGNISGLSLELSGGGEIFLRTGDGGNGNGGAGGAGGSLTSIKATGKASGLDAAAGAGGSTPGAPGIKGGAGGGFANFSYTLDHDDASEEIESAFQIELTAGVGGVSSAGIGGAGGGFTSVNLSLDGSYRTYNGPETSDALIDSTVTAVLAAGAGGGGAFGGKGGDAIAVKVSTVHDQFTEDGRIYLHYLAAAVIAGNGGIGTAGDGGAGGSINGATFTGVTYFDKDSVNVGDTPLILIAGNAGDGSAKGGAGGSIASVIAQNAPGKGFSNIQHNHLLAASIAAGLGGTGGTGDGGTGGAVSSLSISATSDLFVVAGNGGNSGTAATSKGGAGGSISKSTLALVDNPAANSSALISTAGNGGSGRILGGAGGSILSVTANVAASNGVSAVFTAGEGGSASGTGATGGKGGDISGLNSTKDIVSHISLIEAGNGGDAPAGKGGAGGSVLNIRTSGYIGRPAGGVGVFEPLATAASFGVGINTQIIPGTGIAQGLFVGRGGAGATAGLAGSVSKVSAEGIAAIGAAVDAAGLFAAAEKVATVTAAFIGYDADNDNTFDGPASPGTARPLDGFLFAKTVTAVTAIIRPGFSFTA